MAVKVCFMGNPLAGDDGIGPYLYNQLKDEDRLSSFTLIDAGTIGIDLISYVNSQDALIIVDAVHSARDIGEVIMLREKDICPESNPISQHDIGVAEAMTFLRASMPKLKPIILIAININAMQEQAPCLSSEMTRHLPRMIEEVITLIVRSERKATSKKDEMKANPLKKLCKVFLASSRRYWILIALAICLSAFGKSMMTILLILLMAALSILISLHRLVIPINTGIETTLFFSGMISIALNPILGIAFALSVLLIISAIHRSICIFLVIKMALYTVLCLIAYAISPLGMITAGITISILRNAILFTITLAMNPSRAIRNLPGNIIHAAFTIWLFQGFAPALISLIKP